MWWDENWFPVKTKLNLICIYLLHIDNTYKEIKCMKIKHFMESDTFSLPGLDSSSDLPLGFALHTGVQGVQ